MDQHGRLVRLEDARSLLEQLSVTSILKDNPRAVSLHICVESAPNHTRRQAVPRHQTTLGGPLGPPCLRRKVHQPAILSQNHTRSVGHRHSHRGRGRRGAGTDGGTCAAARRAGLGIAPVAGPPLRSSTALGPAPMPVRPLRQALRFRPAHRSSSCRCTGAHAGHVHAPSPPCPPWHLALHACAVQ